MSLLKVGVLMGGKSLEREVSFNSGRTICDHLDIKKYNVIPLFQDEKGKLYILPWSFLHRGKISDFSARLAVEAREIKWDDLKKEVDIMFPALHGRFAEDGALQGILEVLAIPYVGADVHSSASMTDKGFYGNLLQAHGILVPRTYRLYESSSLYEEELQNFLAHVSYPLIVKPVSEGSSFGVRIVSAQEELEDAINFASTVDPRIRQDVLIQEKIEGMEFSCVAFQREGIWKAFEPTEIVHTDTKYIFEYIDKYMPGAGTKYTPARCSREGRQKIKEATEKVASIVGSSDAIRVDGFLTPADEVVIIESNPFPGMAPAGFTFLQAACDNMTPADLIDATLQSALRSYQMMDNTQEKLKEEQEKSTQARMRIGVLLGGASNEREISLESGRNVVYKLSSHKYEVTPLFMNEKEELYIINNELLVKSTTSEISQKVATDMVILWSDLPSRFDFIFLGLHGGNGENGAVQGALEMLGLPYNGSSVLASSLCMDKNRTKEILHAAGLHVPRGFFVGREKILDSVFKDNVEQAILERGLHYPLIVKPHDDGCSCLVQACSNLHECKDAVEEVFKANKDGCIVEELIEGMELTVGVVGNYKAKAFLPTYTPKRAHVLSMTEKFLPGDGENITPAPLTDEETFFVQKEVERAYKVLQCAGYARLDCFFQHAHISPTGAARVVFLECNTLPALTPATCLFHQAAEAGIRPMELIDQIVQLGIERLSLTREQTIEVQSDQKDFILPFAQECSVQTPS